MPAKTPEASIAGAKRAPSSLVQLTSSIGALVTRSLSWSVRSASSAARTPSGPSNLPPVGWVSRCEPTAIGGRPEFLPRRRANILPTSSTVTVQPSAVHCALSQSRTCRSRSVSVRRQMPPFAVAPICVVSISESHSRWASICRSFTAKTPSGAGRVRLRDSGQWPTKPSHQSAIDLDEGGCWRTNSLNPRRISYDGAPGKRGEQSAMLRVRLKADGRLVEVLPDGSERPIASDPRAIAGAAHQAARAEEARYARNVRGRTGLTQAAFAARIGVPVETVRNWEQGKRSPRGPARALLKVIEEAPDAAFAVLAKAR